MAGENSYKQSIDQAKSEIAEITSAVVKLDEVLAKLAGTTMKAAKNLNAASPNEMNSNIDKAIDNLKKYDAAAEKSRKLREDQVKKESDLRERLRKQREAEERDNLRRLEQEAAANRKAQADKEAQLKREAALREKLEKQKEAEFNKRAQQENKSASNDAKQLANQRALSQAADLEARATSKLAGAYVNLNAKRDQAKKKLLDLISAEKQNVAAINKAQAEYNQLTARINQANAATQNFSKGGLVAATRGVSNLLAAFGVVGGLYMFADMAKQGFNLARTLDSLNFAMKTVITDSKELAATQGFLAQITEDYGAAVVTTTERYTKFRAAAMQSNVTMEDTQRIFGTMTKAAGALGLKTHELEGIYLALEQMLSKGKVTTEELRRQLGERLPGAFGIMADALGVTTSELDSMLRKGEVLSSEALPKFATAVEKAYGIENLTRVENLNASVTRMSNSWVELVGQITNSEGPVSKAMMGIIDSVDSVLKKLGTLNRSLGDMFNQGMDKGYTEMMNQLQKDSEEFGVSIEFVAKERLPMLQEQLAKTTAEYEKHKKQLESFKNLGTDDSIGAAIFSFFGSGKETKMKEAAELMAKHEAMVRTVQMVIAGETELRNTVAEPFNTKSYSDVTKALDFSMKKHEELIAEIEELKKADNANPERLNALQEESAKVGALIKKYAELKDGMTETWGLPEYKAPNPYADRDFIAGKLEAAKSSMNTLKYDENFEANKAAIEAEIKILKKALEYWDGVSGSIDKNIERREILAIGILNNGKAIEESVAALQKLKSEMERQRNELALTSDEWDYFTEKINNIQNLIDIQTKEFDINDFIKLNEDEQLQLTDFLDTEGVETGMKSLSNLLGQEMDSLQEEFYRNYAGDYASFLEFQKMKLEAFTANSKGFSDIQIEQISNWVGEAQAMFGAVMDIMDGFTERRIQNIERERDAMNEMYDLQLSNENLTDARRKEIEDERERRNKELDERKRKEQEKQAKMAKAQAAMNVVVQTSLAIISALAQVPKFDFGVSATAVAATFAAVGAAQLAAVLAQPIPKYKRGRKGGKEEMAILGDGGKHEPILDRHGNLKGISPNTPTLMKLDKGDTVLPSTNHLHKDYQGILNASIMTTLASATVNNDSDKLARIFDKKLSNLKSEMRSGIKEGFRGVALPKNNDIGALARELNFNRKRDAI